MDFQQRVNHVKRESQLFSKNDGSWTTERIDQLYNDLKAITKCSDFSSLERKEQQDIKYLKSDVRNFLSQKKVA